MNNSTSGIDAVDVRNLGEMRRLFSRVDPVPGDLLERVKFDLTVRALQAEVAELTQSALVSTRAEDTPQETESVTFTSGSLSLMITTTRLEDGLSVRLDGWVTRSGAIVDAVSGGVTVTETSDVNGRFVIASIPRGRVYFVIHPETDDAAGRAVVSPTIDL